MYRVQNYNKKTGEEMLIGYTEELNEAFKIIKYIIERFRKYHLDYSQIPTETICENGTTIYCFYDLSDPKTEEVLQIFKIKPTTEEELRKTDVENERKFNELLKNQPKKKIVDVDWNE